MWGRSWCDAGLGGWLSSVRLEGALEAPCDWNSGGFSLLPGLVAAEGWLVPWPGAVTSGMWLGPEAAGWGPAQGFW